VIDSFRYCKEKNLFRHFSSFQGTLTVPVQKLLTHPQLASWIKECDWLMYQKMLAYVAPLTTQVVPDRVLKAVGFISRGLIAHIRETFKTHPEHVSLARLLPARIFCHLLKRMLDVNQAATAVAAWLCHTDNRTQMWEDFESLVDPMEAIAKANIPPCSVRGAAVILNEHVKTLLSPLENKSPPEVQLYDQELGYQKFTYSSTAADDYSNFPDRWINFILKLAVIFPRHPTRCLIDKVDSLWTCILHRLTLGGAQSFSAWWMTKVFFCEMMIWQAEKGGFMSSTPRSLERSALEPMQGLHIHEDMTKESPPNHTTQGGHENSALSPVLDDQEPRDVGGISSNAHAALKVNQNSFHLADTSVDNGIHSENEKSTNVVDAHASHNTLNHDDSAIELADDSVLLAGGKYGDMMASDSADAEGDVVVV
jgi:regulatory factor X